MKADQSDVFKGRYISVIVHSAFKDTLCHDVIIMTQATQELSSIV